MRKDISSEPSLNYKYMHHTQLRMIVLLLLKIYTAPAVACTLAVSVSPIPILPVQPVNQCDTILEKQKQATWYNCKK